MAKGKVALADPEIIRARRLPVGAEVQPGAGVHFRVWAPRRKRVFVVLEGAPERESGAGNSSFELARENDEGYFSALVEPAGAGTLYRFRLDSEGMLFPDPASRFQPDGPHGPSRVVDPDVFKWTDRKWKGVGSRGQVVYEMHIGTFTRDGQWNSAAGELEELRRIGITVIEIMPVAEFPGRFGWGYDGVDLFAPCRLYGEPDDFRRFVDRAHAAGLGVILDVVYNHLGPDGNFLPQFSESYFSEKRHTDWGAAINFDGPGAGPVREFFIANAGYWMDEYHLDGLRIDATQNIYDDSEDHILSVITRTVRESAKGRMTFVVGENEPQDVRLIRPPEEGGFGLDAVWNDDFHHSAMVSLTGYNEAYYTDYLGNPQEFVSMAKRGFLYQGQRYKWQKKRRGTPTYGRAPFQFINFIQNHDQVANSGHGLRAHFLTSPGQYRAMTALLLLSPGTPMLLQGQEFAASNPFFYFANHKEEISRAILEGRAQFLAQFRSLAQPDMRAKLPDPGNPETFVSSKLNLAERVEHAPIYQLHQDLLRLRHDDPVFGAQEPGGVDGAVLGNSAFVLRFFGLGGDDRLLVVNFGVNLNLDPAPEPLLAPPAEREWDILWSSEDPQYGGTGTAPLDTWENWMIPGHAAVALIPSPKRSLSNEQDDTQHTLESSEQQ